MGAPSPELCNLWLARAFNAHDVDAAAAMYHPESSIVQVDEVHGGTSIARGSEAIRKTMADYIGLKPHMDVITHHTTIAGDFAMTRSQWLIKGIGKNGQPTEVHHHGMEVHRRLPDGTWVFFMDHPFGADPSWAVAAPPHTEQLKHLARHRDERGRLDIGEETQMEHVLGPGYEIFDLQRRGMLGANFSAVRTI